MNTPDKVILHCSDTPDSTSSRFSIYHVDNWHRARGFDKVGYHKYIRRDGLIEDGRHYSEIGAHAKGYNTGSIGICYEGTYFPTLTQLNSLIELYREIHKRFGIDYKSWYGHNDFTDLKKCPGFKIEVLRQILSLV